MYDAIALASWICHARYDVIADVEVPQIGWVISEQAASALIQLICCGRCAVVALMFKMTRIRCAVIALTHQIR